MAIENFNRQITNYERFYTNIPDRQIGRLHFGPTLGNGWATTAVNEGETID